MVPVVPADGLAVGQIPAQGRTAGDWWGRDRGEGNHKGRGISTQAPAAQAGVKRVSRGRERMEKFKGITASPLMPCSREKRKAAHYAGCVRNGG